MRQIFILIMLLTASIVTNASNFTPSSVKISESTPILVDFRKLNYPGSTDVERSLGAEIVEAYLCPSAGDLVVNLFGIGDATIYLIDRNNNIVDDRVLSTDTPSTIELSIDIPGYYSIIIISDSCYAEGDFLIP